jgi:tRNA-modifying protein YgfZ
MTFPSTFLPAAATLSEDGAEILHFGDVAGELAAAATSTVVAPLRHLGLLACDGEDAQSFLHNQLTSDVNHLYENAAQHAAWCTAKGRMVASFIIYRQTGGYHLLLAADLVEAVQKRLQMYVLRSKVQLHDLRDEVALFGVAGPQAAALLAGLGFAAPPAVLAISEQDGAVLVQIEAERYLLVVPAERAATVWQELAASARPVGTPAWRWLDVRGGLPLITAVTREAFVPQMADFDKLGGVSFHKGCYPGQEVVARTQYLGKVKRHLFRVTSAQALAAGDELHSPEYPDQESGRIVIAAPSPGGGYEALAVVQSNFAHDLHLGDRSGPLLAATALHP